MASAKSPAALVDRFSAVVPDAPDVVRRSMFGYPAATVNGHLFMSLHRDRLILRLGDADLARFKEAGAADFEPMAGRPMSGFAVVPGEVLDDAQALRGWIDRALAAARSRPAKVPRPRAPARPRITGS